MPKEAPHARLDEADYEIEDRVQHDRRDLTSTELFVLRDLLLCKFSS